MLSDLREASPDLIFVLKDSWDTSVDSVNCRADPHESLVDPGKMFARFVSSSFDLALVVCDVLFPFDVLLGGRGSGLGLALALASLQSLRLISSIAFSWSFSHHDCLIGFSGLSV